ncbi:MAG: hypothetical protein JNM31_02490 [Flavobacteriales bacterium]|nr:hypothetical protein [Flavobacteriales bacterium]
MRTTIIILAGLFLTTGLTAQTDSTTKAVEKQSPPPQLELGINSRDGAYAHVKGPQDSTGVDHPDTIRIESKRKIITIITEPRDSTRKLDPTEQLRGLRRERRNKFTYWAGVDFGFNNWVGPNGSMELDSADAFMELVFGRSRYIAINIMEQKWEFGSHRAGLFTGLGVEWFNYRLANNVLLGFDRDSTYAVQVESPTYNKNKLRQFGLRVPLMFEFNTKHAPLPTADQLAKCGEDRFSRKGNFHIAVGVVGSVFLETMYKVRYTRDGRTIKDRSSGNYNLLPYRLAAAVRFGYGGLNLFAEYALTPLFQDGRGPELTPFTVGITLVNFN